MITNLSTSQSARRRALRLLRNGRMCCSANQEEQQYVSCLQLSVPLHVDELRRSQDGEQGHSVYKRTDLLSFVPDWPIRTAAHYLEVQHAIPSCEGALYR